jgi:hypothetical protein
MSKNKIDVVPPPSDKPMTKAGAVATVEIGGGTEDSNATEPGNTPEADHSKPTDAAKPAETKPAK